MANILAVLSIFNKKILCKINSIGNLALDLFAKNIIFILLFDKTIFLLFNIIIQN